MSRTNEYRPSKEVRRLETVSRNQFDPKQFKDPNRKSRSSYSGKIILGSLATAVALGTGIYFYNTSPEFAGVVDSTLEVITKTLKEASEK